jgi:hypothetical protein
VTQSGITQPRGEAFVAATGRQPFYFHHAILCGCSWKVRPRHRAIPAPEPGLNTEPNHGISKSEIRKFLLAEPTQSLTQAI